MIETLLSIVIGSLAGVITFITCMTFWEINPQKVFSKAMDLNFRSEAPAIVEESKSFPIDSPLRLSIDYKKQELALAKEGATVIGSYINIERNFDGMQTNQRIFLN